MERVSLTEAEIVQALTDAMSQAEGGDDGMTVAEMEAATGAGNRRVRLALRKLMEAGKLEVGRRPTTSLVGARVFTPVYRVKP